MRGDSVRTAALLLLAAVLIAVRAVAQEAPAPAPAKPAPAAVPAGPVVSSMKIICDGKVKSDGVTSFVFTPAGGEAAEIRVTLQKGTDRKDVCRDVAKEFSVALSGAPYGVDRYDADKVKVQGKKGAKFSLSLGSQTATGLTIELK